MLLFVGIVLAGIFFWLNMYTNHGQAIVMPDFIDQEIDDARNEAEDLSFQIIVNDSIHIVGRPGGLIIDQNPKADSKVKENRKIYVTTTKYAADIVKLEDLSTLYGERYQSKSNELTYSDINTKVIGEKYDPAEPGTILEVYLGNTQIDGRSGRKANIEIEKGDTLGFVISKNAGAQINVPDLRCTTLAGARFALNQSKLQLGEIKHRDKILNSESAYIVDQFPRPGPGSVITMDGAIQVFISQTKPEDCL